MKGALLAPVTVVEQALSGAPAPLFYLGAGALAAIGVVEWPVAGLFVAGGSPQGRRRAGQLNFPRDQALASHRQEGLCR